MGERKQSMESKPEMNQRLELSDRNYNYFQRYKRKYPYNESINRKSQKIETIRKKYVKRI